MALEASMMRRIQSSARASCRPPHAPANCVSERRCLNGVHPGRRSEGGDSRQGRTRTRGRRPFGGRGGPLTAVAMVTVTARRVTLRSAVGGRGLGVRRPLGDHRGTPSCAADRKGPSWRTILQEVPGQVGGLLGAAIRADSLHPASAGCPHEAAGRRQWPREPAAPLASSRICRAGSWFRSRAALRSPAKTPAGQLFSTSPGPGNECLIYPFRPPSSGVSWYKAYGASEGVRPDGPRGREFWLSPRT